MKTATLEIRVVQRASKSEVVGFTEGVLLVRVAAPATEGRANRALVRLLSQVLGVPPRDVRILRGEKSRSKLVRIEGIGPEEAMVRLDRQG